MAVDRSVLEVEPRESSGKGPARRLRAQGMVPAIVYGRHLKHPQHISVNPIAVRQAIATPHKLNTLITLKVKGGGDQLVLLKDYQQEPVTREVLHVDFIAVKENEAVKVNVPLVLVGKAVGVAEGGILSQNRRELEVLALPNAIPEKIEVDVSHLKVAQALHINDVKLPAGIQVKSHVNYTLAVVNVPEREEVVAPVAVAAVPGTPGAEGAAAAPAADGKAAPAAGGKAPAGAGGKAPAAGAAAAPAAGKKDDKKK